MTGIFNAGQMHIRSLTDILLKLFDNVGSADNPSPF